MHLIVHLILASWYGYCSVQGDKATLCSSWDSLEKNLKNEEFQLICTKAEDCQSLNCSGSAHGHLVNSRIQLYSCENLPSIEFEANIPDLGVKNFKKRIYHNDSVSLSKNMKVDFELQRKNQELVMAIFLHYTYNGSFPLLHMSPRIPVASHIAFPIDCEHPAVNALNSNQKTKSISSTNVPTQSSLVLSKRLEQKYKNCSITTSSCGPDEICQQISKDVSDGICTCISSYKRDKSGKCVFEPTIDTPTEGPAQALTPGLTEKTTNVSLLAKILVPIALILVFVAAVYTTIRFRVFQHLRRRLRVQVYEHVLLGEEDDEEDLANPVA